MTANKTATRTIQLTNPHSRVLRDLCAVGAEIRGITGRPARQEADECLYPDTHGTVLVAVPDEWAAAGVCDEAKLRIPHPSGLDHIIIQNDAGFALATSCEATYQLPWGRTQSPLYIRIPAADEDATTILIRVGGYRVRRYTHPETQRPEEVWQLPAAAFTRSLHIGIDGAYLTIENGGTTAYDYTRAATWTFTLYDEAEIVVGTPAVAGEFLDRGLTIPRGVRRFDTWEDLLPQSEALAGLHVISDHQMPPADVIPPLGAVSVVYNNTLLQITPRRLE